MFRKVMVNEDASGLGNSALFAVERAADGQQLTMTVEARFENFYNEYSHPLWAYVCRVANSSEIADDVVQESFLRFLGVPARANLDERAYLYRIATNLVYDYFRRNSRDEKRQINLVSDKIEDEVYELFAVESEVAQVFDKLKLQERALLWLAYVEGHEHSEIAQMLGLKSLSVRVLLFRARRKLAVLLDANNFGVEKL
jgi:RNA polymerase sigma-70 factor (ECF subfamily)